MIQTPTQLKALVKNHTHSDSNKAQLWFRNYAMERLLERVSVSEYRDNFILKGGVLVSSLVGLSNRSTMDIDTTVQNLPLDKVTLHRILHEICEIELGDNMRFEIKDASEIMEESEYPGIRVSMNAYLSTMRIPLKVDVSTGDVITPAAVSYQYKMLFEDRYITLWAYNTETVLAEKMETLLARGAFNTRMRDFYDMYILQNSGFEIDEETLCRALIATSNKRGSSHALSSFQEIEADVCDSSVMRALWNNFQNKYDYAKGLTWETVSNSAFTLCRTCLELDMDLRAYDQAMAAFKKEPITYTLGEVCEQLDLGDGLVLGM